ncbi:MAG: hypothetical protein E7590_09660 [Ruminococcaceae bacterium]|nr:hypothetical protein [Oscillospiraceae bacterium]
METKKVLKKTGKIAGNVLLWVFVFLCILGIFMTISAKRKGDGAATILGMQMRVVQSPSMEKCDATDVSGYRIKDIRTGSMIFINVVPKNEAKAEKWYSKLEVGDVLTFRYVYTTQETITHRITSIEKKPTGGYIIELQGDNKTESTGVLTQVIDTSDVNSYNYVIGKVTGQSYVFGRFMQALRGPVGLICIVILPSVIIIILEVVKILNMLNADKRKARQKKEAEQQSELDALKRRLAELEAANNSAAADAAQTDTVTNGEEP